MKLLADIEKIVLKKFNKYIIMSYTNVLKQVCYREGNQSNYFCPSEINFL